MNRRNLLTLALVALSATALTPLPALAQAKYPERPIKLMVAFSAGGVNDVVGRQWADRMKPLLGTVVIENIGGAGGSLGVAGVARAQPDGYTLVLANTSNMVVANPPALRSDPRFRTYLPSRQWRRRLRCSPVASDAYIERARGPCEVEPKQTVLWLAGGRNNKPPCRRDVQTADRNTGYCAHPLSWRRPAFV